VQKTISRKGAEVAEKAVNLGSLPGSLIQEKSCDRISRQGAKAAKKSQGFGFKKASARYASLPQSAGRIGACRQSGFVKIICASPM
jgi:hypothetical protein